MAEEMWVAQRPGEEFYNAFNAGIKLLEEGKEDEANKLFLDLTRRYPEAWLSIGCEAMKEQDWPIALRRFQEVYDVAPKGNLRVRAAALNNMGTVHANTGHRDVALKYFERALDVAPNYADALVNFGLALKWTGNPEQGLRYIERGLRINHLQGQGEFARALALLVMGRYRDGWKAYEARWRTEHVGICKTQCPMPEWEGQDPIPGQVLCLYAEQGMGDTIQMLRFGPPLAERGWIVQAAVHEPLKTLAAAMGCFREVISLTEPITQFDFQCPMFSLPRLFRIEKDSDIPSRVPYVKATEPVNLSPGFHVGICWKGNKTYRNDIWRSTKLADWFDLLDTPGVSWHSLQVADDTSETALVPRLHCWEKPKDMLETANRMAGLDLIITIDTSVAHLAGALGKPVWMLTPFAPDFRWQLKREDSPWYPTLKLYRQAKEFEWKPVFERITNDLRQLIEKV